MAHKCACLGKSVENIVDQMKIPELEACQSKASIRKNQGRAMFVMWRKKRVSRMNGGQERSKEMKIGDSHGDGPKGDIVLRMSS